MTVEEAVRQRRTVRRFLPDPVSATDLREILAQATLAPSISNRQMWRFIVVTSDPLRRMLARLVERRIDELTTWPEFAQETQRIRVLRESALTFAGAPAVILVVNQGYHVPIEAMLVEHGEKAPAIAEQFGHPDIQSIGGMLGYLMLLAEARGYGACWMTDPLVARRDLHAALEIPSGEQVVALMALGYPAEVPAPRPRRPIDTLIEWR